MQTWLERYLTERLPAALRAHASALAHYCALVHSYAKVLNLTAHEQPAAIADELALSALDLLELGEFAAGWRCIDLGSGNGSPVVPLAICCSWAQIAAVESRQRRAAFLVNVQTALKLDNLSVLTARVEDIARADAHCYHLVTARAFAPPAKLLPFAAALLRPEGELRGFCGADASELLQAAARLGASVETRDAGAPPEQPRVYRVRFAG